MITLQTEFANRKGKILRGTVTLPGAAGPYPVVVNLHGFGGSRMGYKSMHVSMARELAAAGIACVRYDFYGNGESDGEFEEMTFTSLLEDSEDIWAWTLSQNWCDRERMILSGQSLGGFVAASAAPRVSEKLLILMCPGAGMWFGCAERSREMEKKGILYGDIEGLKFSHDFNYDLARYNPFEDAKGAPAEKVLIIRGTADKLVDDRTCETYLALYPQGSVYKKIENANHNFASINHRRKLNETIVSFIKENI